MNSSDGAHDLHRLVLLHGRERARQMVDVKMRPLVDIAADVLADESQRIGISYTGFWPAGLSREAKDELKPFIEIRLTNPVPDRLRGRVELARQPRRPEACVADANTLTLIG